MAAVAGADEAGRHGIAMHGTPRLPEGFSALPHVNPHAPKGGRLALGVLGSFDSLNPLIVRGIPAEGLREYVYETLLARNPDEPFALYGLIAERVSTPPDRGSVTFTLDRRARFSDGQPITAADVLFSYELLKQKGRPNHRTYYGKVATAEALDPHRVRFRFTALGDRELPLILGLMPVLPRHRIDPERFEQTSLQPPIGSGPYLVGAVEPGKSLVLTRDPNWWGADLPVNRGRYNFAELRFDYFRDAGTLFEAFRTGAVHFRREESPALWAEGYEFAAVSRGDVRRLEVGTGLPAPMMGFALNTRRPALADLRVRRALALLFDFDWINKNLYHGLQTRTQSYFQGSELSALGRPAGAAEQALLAPHAALLSPGALEGRLLEVSDPGDEGRRKALREALSLLQAAGYEIRGKRLISSATARPLTLELLAATRAQERLMLAYARTLERVGIDARVRLVDSAEYESRKKDFDFDIIQSTWLTSLSPGNEQTFRWGSRAADSQGSFNFAGVRSPAVDAVIEAMLSADTREAFVDATRALDRLLTSGAYVVPLFHTGRQWLAYWRPLEPAPRTTLYGYDLTAWWGADARR